MKQHNQIAQGDIYFAKIDESKLPKDLKFKPVSKEFIFARGEVTGHSHKVMVAEREDTQSIEIAEAGNGLFYLKIKNQALITHEDHHRQGTLTETLTQGLWFVSRQIEYDAVKERLVRD